MTTSDRPVERNRPATNSRVGQVLERMRLAAPSAEAEVMVRWGFSGLTRFANSFIHQNVAEEGSHVLLRVALDGQVASVSFDGPRDEEHLGRVVDNAIEAARAQPRDPDWPGLTPPSRGVLVDHYDKATAVWTADERAQRVADFVAASKGLETAGFCSTSASLFSYANSAGHVLSARATHATFDGIARTATADGSGRKTSVSLAALDGREIGAEAERRAREASNPTDLEPGRYEVILEPECVANLLSFLLIHGFNGKAVEEGRSFARLGEKQFDMSLTLRDDVTDSAMIGIPFDVEGTPKRPLDLVSAGVTRGLLHNRRTARKAGTESTGHAIEGGGSYGAAGANLVLSAGAASAEALVAGVERGLLVTDFWYTRILDPKTQVVTGLTRNGVWLVEDGRIVRPVTNMRFTQSFVEALAPGAVRAVGSEPALLFGGWDSVYLVPALHLESWNFTGGAKG